MGSAVCAQHQRNNGKYMGEKGKVLHTAKTHTIGGRDRGRSRSSDGHLDVRLSDPGSEHIGTNPEHLFAAAWSACFESALALAASKRNIALPANVSIGTEIDLNLGDTGYFLTIRFDVSLPGVERHVAKALIKQAHEICPYSKATRGNVDVATNLVEQGQSRTETVTKP
jgi:lipoyl-dependent peroxiredoxin